MLEWFNYPSASTHPRCEVSCQRVWNKQASSLCLCFVEARTMAECCIALESVLTNSLVSKLLHCLLLALCEFHTTSEEHCKQHNRWVCAKPFCQKYLKCRMIAARYANLLLIKYSRVGGYTKDLNKGGWAFAWDNKVWR